MLTLKLQTRNRKGAVDEKNIIKFVYSLNYSYDETDVMAVANNFKYF